jgi:RND superfamily putative drug exporter
MLARFARLATRHTRSVLVAALLFVVVAGAAGGGVADHLTSGGFEDPGTESVRAEKALADRFHTGIPNVVLVVTARDGDVDAPAVAAAGRDLAADLDAEPDVTDVVSYWSEGNAPPLRSDDGRRALVLARLTGDEEGWGTATASPPWSPGSRESAPTPPARSPSTSAASPTPSTWSATRSRRTWSRPR